MLIMILNPEKVLEESYCPAQEDILRALVCASSRGGDRDGGEEGRTKIDAIQ